MLLRHYQKTTDKETSKKNGNEFVRNNIAELRATLCLYLTSLGDKFFEEQI